jgi:hypothetical protein
VGRFKVAIEQIFDPVTFEFETLLRANDLADPRAPTEINSQRLVCKANCDSFVTDGWVFANDGSDVSTGGILVPRFSLITYSLTPGSGLSIEGAKFGDGRVTNIVVSDNLALLTRFSIDYSEMYLDVWSVAEPRSPLQIASKRILAGHPAFPGILGVVVARRIAVLASFTHLLSFDLSDPFNPVARSSIPLQSSELRVNGMAIESSRVFIGHETGISEFPISSNGSLGIRVYKNLGGRTSVKGLVGSDLYTRTGGELNVYDVSAAGQPVLRSATPVPETPIYPPRIELDNDGDGIPNTCDPTPDLLEDPLFPEANSIVANDAARYQWRDCLDCGLVSVGLNSAGRTLEAHSDFSPAEGICSYKYDTSTKRVFPKFRPRTDCGTYRCNWKAENDFAGLAENDCTPTEQTFCPVNDGNGNARPPPGGYPPGGPPACCLRLTGFSAYYWGTGACLANRCATRGGDPDGDFFCSNGEDNCPFTPNNTPMCIGGSRPGAACEADFECGTGGFCSAAQGDRDGDGVGDACDNCARCLADRCATRGGDPDGDFFCSDGADNCPLNPNATWMCIGGSRPGAACTGDLECGTGGFCSPAQGDWEPDGVGDACDNCRFRANPLQEVGGQTGVPSGPSQPGDACLCGDVNGDRRVDASDASTILKSRLRPPPTGLVFDAERCDVNADTRCDASDATTILKSRLRPPAAAVLQSCTATGQATN